MKIKNVLEITKKELKNQFDHIGGYLLIAIFLGITYFIFLKTFFLIGNASMRGFFQTLPWLLMVYIPAITMGSFAGERGKQTLEYLTSKPIKTIDLITGKILGAGLFATLTLLLTLPLPIFISQVGKLDWGETFAGYFGSILVIFALSAIGVMISSFFKNTITAFLTSVFVIGILNLIGSTLVSFNLNLNISNTLVKISLIERLNSISRGVIEANDIIYFILIIIFSYSLAYLNIEKIRLPNVKNFAQKIVITLVLTLIIGVGLIYSSALAKSRIDLTANQKYTLSQSTKNIINKDGKIKIDVYASSNLPTQFTVVYDELKNILKDYQAQSSNISVEYKNATDEVQSLNELGIAPVQFNVVGQDKYEIQQGYLAVVISDISEISTDQTSADNETTETTTQLNSAKLPEIIPFVGNVPNLEYELTSKINKLKQVEKPAIAFAIAGGEKSIYSDYSVLNQLLENDYEITTVNLSIDQDSLFQEEDEKESLPEIPDLSKYKVLVIADPTNNYSEPYKNAIDNYIQSGGQVIYLSSPLDMDMQTMTASIPSSKRGNLFENYGITINQDFVYDTQSNLPVVVNTTQGNLPISYPFFIKAIQKEKYSETSPQTINIPWASSLTINEPDNWKVLYETTDKAGSQSSAYDLNPLQEFFVSGTKYPVVAMREFENGGKLVVVGNSNLLADQYITGTDENLLFGLSLAEYLSQTEGLTSIRAKNLYESQIVTLTQTQKNGVRYIAPILSIILLSLIGVQRVVHKKRLVKTYS